MGLLTTVKRFFDLDEDMDSLFNEEEHQNNANPQRPIKEKPSTGTMKNVVNLKNVQQQTKVMLFEPRSFDDVQTIANQLKNHRAVVFNLQRIATDEAKGLVDFMSGAVYALDGSIQKLGPKTFICTPNNVDIDGVITEAIEKDTF